MKVWEVAVELNMNSSNVVKIEIEASTENKARVNAEIKARKKYNTNFVKSVNVKYLGIYKES
jgi:hypothetical protein|nr:MAG: hypothetical protein [Bacteriophage sp.]